MQFLLKEGGTIDNTLQDEHFYRERSLISTNAPSTHERIIAAFVTVANSRVSSIQNIIVAPAWPAQAGGGVFFIQVY